MTLKKRLAKIEQSITSEIREAEIELNRRADVFFKKAHLPLPAGATMAEYDEVRRRLLEMHAKARAGTMTEKDSDEWFQWVDSIHRKYGCEPPA